MQFYCGVAAEEGITDEEIGTIMGIVMQVSAAKVSSQFRIARIEAKKSARKKKSKDKAE